MVAAGRSSGRRRPCSCVGWPAEPGSERPSGGLIDQKVSAPTEVYADELVAVFPAGAHVPEGPITATVLTVWPLVLYEPGGNTRSSSTGGSRQPMCWFGQLWNSAASRLSKRWSAPGLGLPSCHHWLSNGSISPDRSSCGPSQSHSRGRLVWPFAGIASWTGRSANSQRAHANCPRDDAECSPRRPGFLGDGWGIPLRHAVNRRVPPRR